MLTFFLVAVTAFGLIPSMITLEAPSFKRLIIIMPSLMIFIGMAVSKIGALLPSPKAGIALAVAVVTVTGIADYQAYFVDWAAAGTTPASHFNRHKPFDTVYDIYRDDLQQLALYLQGSGAEVVAASTPNEELDPLLYKYSGGAAIADTQVVFFNSLFNIPLSRKPMRLFVSPLSPIWEKHAHWLTAEFGARRLDSLYRQDGKLAFEVYEMSRQPDPLLSTLEAASETPVFVERKGAVVELEFPVQFDDLLLLRGIELPERRVYGENYGVHNQLYVEPLRASDASIQFFMHLIDQDGVLVAQRDYLGVPAVHWHPDVLFMQDHFVPFWERVSAGLYHLYFGVYDWRSDQRFAIVDENGQALADRLYLGEIEVIDRSK